MTFAASAIAWLTVYLIALLVATFWKRRPRTAEDWLWADKRVGPWLTGLGIAATLFSAFTLVGMPDFFRANGVAAWIFLGVTDVAMAAIMLFAGLRLRRLVSANRRSAPSITSFLFTGPGKASGWFYVIATTVFLLPYMTIQIKGPSLLLQSALPLLGGSATWSAIVVAVILFYSAVGGIRAVYSTDAIQGLALLSVAIVVGVVAATIAGSPSQLFAAAQGVNERLLSAPGPAGVLTSQFLLISFISICAMPYVQPQLATRILIARDDAAFKRGAAFLGFFAFLVILPTIFIGFRLTQHPGVGITPLMSFLRDDLHPVLAGGFVMAVLAASMSTIDSQLFAVGTEWASAIGGGQPSPGVVKATGGIAALLVLVLSQMDVGSIVLFSVNSFIGTSLLAPFLIAGVVSSAGMRAALVATACASAVVFVLVLAGFIPGRFGPLRTEIWLYVIEASVMCVPWLTGRRLHLEQQTEPAL